MNTNLLNNLKRLYLLPNQAFHEQSEDGASYFPLDALPRDGFKKHCIGEVTLALNLVSQDGLTKAMLIDFDGCAHGNREAHWQALTKLHRALTQELDLPAPAISISGRKGYGLWISLTEPIPIAQAQAFLRGLKAVYLSDIPKDQIDLRPDCTEPTKAAQAVVKLPPCLHRANNKWSAFISLEEGDQYINAPWLDIMPSLEQQALLLELLQSVPLSNFMQAVERLRKIGGATSANSDPATPCSPDFTKAPNKNFIAPCIQALLDKGVPTDMPYHTANLNLANYCHSAGMEKGQARLLAKRLSDNTSEDDRTKNEHERLKHFNSVPNKQFYCDYPRNIAAWRDTFGGKMSCHSCPINASCIKQEDKEQNSLETPSKDNVVLLETLQLKKEVAFDLLKYTWDNSIDISHLEIIWPLIELPYQFKFKTSKQNLEPLSRHLTLDWFKLAAKLSGKDTSNATFLNETHKYIHNHTSYNYVKRQYQDQNNKLLIDTEENTDKICFMGDAPNEMALNYRQPFFDSISTRVVNKEHGASTLAYAETLEAKAKLFSDVRKCVLNPYNSISDVFSQTGNSLNEMIKREEQETPFGNRRYQLFQEIFAKRQFVKTPFSYLDYLLDGGFVKGRLYVLLAPPKAGKTTFAATCMDYAAASGHPVLYMGYEMGKAQMVLYGLARKAGISASKIQAVNLNEDEQETILQTFKSYSENEGKLLTITEACSQYTLANAIAWISLNKNLHSEKTPLVVIDYLQIAFSGIKEIDSHASASERVSQMAVMCKQIARKQEVALLVLSSVTKVGENDSSSKGIIDVTAARDSLAIIHAADGVLSLQTSMVSIKRKEGSNIIVETRDPWEMLESFCREQGNESEAENILKGRQNQDKNYPQGKNSANTRAVLYLLRHRGGIGQVPLYYRKALHQFEEVPLCQAHKAYYERKDPTQLLQKADFLFNQENEQVRVSENFNAVLRSNNGITVCNEKNVMSEIKTLGDNIKYHYITHQEEAISEIKRLSGTVALDLETTGLDPLTAQIRLLSLYDGETTLVIDIFRIGGIHKVKAEIEALSAVGHNSIFDMKFLKQFGINLVMDCTMIGHHILTGERRKLKELSEHYLELEMNKEEQISDWNQDTLTESQLQYAALDVQRTFEIWKKINDELEDTDSLKAYEITKNAQPSITQAELTGISFNVEKHKELLLSLETRKLELKNTLDSHLGTTSYSSSKQLSEWLTTQLGGAESTQYKKWPKTSKGQLITGGDELKKHAVLLPKEACTLIIDALVPIKDIDKQLNSFGQSITDKIHHLTGRIHPSFNIIGARTGRMSCSNPNFQQMPREKEFRELFYAPKHSSFIIADYSQIELRVAAEVAQEQKMLGAFKEGLDAHKATAALILNKNYEDIPAKSEDRSKAKAVNFGMLYGMGAAGLMSSAQSSYGVTMTEKQAQEYISAWFNAYPGFKQLHGQVKRESGRLLMVSTPAGRKRKWKNRNEYKFTSAINTIPQGGAAEVMLLALGKLTISLTNFDAKIIAVVHDEIIIECVHPIANEVLHIVVKDMTQAMVDLFPNAATNGLVDAKIVCNWGEK